jgi:hypothetical protein
MAELRLNIDDDFLDSVKGATGITKPAQLTAEALNLLKWAANEARNGRIITTADPDGSNPIKIVIPSLSNLRKNS